MAHGYLVAAIAAGLFVEPSPGPVLANYGVDRLRSVKPVNPGDELTVTLTARRSGHVRAMERSAGTRWSPIRTMCRWQSTTS